MISPCKNCEMRSIGCHSVCKYYKTYRENLDNFNSKIKEEKNKEVAFIEYKREKRKHR